MWFGLVRERKKACHRENFVWIYARFQRTMIIIWSLLFLPSSSFATSINRIITLVLLFTFERCWYMNAVLGIFLSFSSAIARSHFARWYVFFFAVHIFCCCYCLFFFCLLHRCVDLALFSVTQYVRFLLHICITIPFSLAFVPITHSILLSDCVRWFLLLLLLVLLFPFA